MKHLLMAALIIVFLLNPLAQFSVQATPDFTCADVTEIPQIECEALVALYNSTNGPDWIDAAYFWLQTNIPSNWYGVTVENGHVTGLLLSLLELSGSIPPEIGNLSKLRSLDLSWNQISGVIPPEMGMLTSLQVLSLGYNQLDGDVPASFINLVNLYDAGGEEYPYGGLSLDYNTLNVPPGYPDLSNPLHVLLHQKDDDWHLHQYITTCAEVSEIPQAECEVLAALYNSTNGDYWINNTGWLAYNLPSGWYGVTVEAGHVTRLDLHENRLSGSLPADLVNLSSLSSLRLYSNQLNGSIPAALGNLSNLTELWLFKNQLSGSIPPELGNLGSLVNLSLWSNQLSGSIPPELGQLTSLDQLDLSYNLLSGAIPPQLGELSSLKSLILKYNQFSSSIPPELGNLSSLQSLSLSNNRLSGVIPPELGQLSSLTYLYLYGNGLSGAIPSELGNLSALQELYLASNLLIGPIPLTLCNLGSLEVLNLYHNQLNGVLPPELGNLGSLKWLHLASNQLSGSLPPALGNLSSLEWLILSDNQLTGSIPAELGSLSSLTDLSLAGNQLSGAIPTEIGNLTNLRMLHLNQNMLNDDIPVTFTNLINLFAPGTYGENGDGLDLDYNALNVPAGYPDPADPLLVFLSQKDPDWHLYQAFEQVISSEGGVLTSLDGSVEFFVPDETLDADTTFAFTPQSETGYDTGWLSFAGSSFQLTAEDIDGLVTTFDPPLTVTLYYSDADLGSTPEKSLALYYWDMDKNAWVNAITTCPGGTYTRDLAGNTLSLPLCHLSEFAMLGEPYRSLLPMVQVSR